jgi:hypothetical protein
LSRYPAGAVVTLPRVIGHRDVGLTECPGNALYAQVNGIRKFVQKRIKHHARSSSGTGAVNAAGAPSR